MGQDWKYLSDRIGGVMSVSCPDSNNCFCLVQETLGFDDTGPLLFKSSDQGKTWDSIYKSYPEKWPNITLFNGREGVSTDKDNYYIAWWDVPAISKSTDGGHNFSKIFLDTTDLYNRNLYEFTMYDSNFGYARADGGYYFTMDGWETFEKRIFDFKLGSPRFRPRSPYYLNSNTICYIVYWLDDILGGTFMKYHIQENIWDTLYYFGINKSTNRVNEIINFYFLNDTLGFACGYQKTGIGETRNGLLFRTKDGGHNWNIVLKDSTIPNFGFNDIAFYDDKRGVLTGYLGKIFFTTDGGDTWVRSYLPNGTDYQRAEIMHPEWAGHYPIVGTSGIGIYRYEGDYFGFPPTPKFPIIQADDYDFGTYEMQNADTLSKVMKIYNNSDSLELFIIGYSSFTESSFWTDLPLIDSLNPIIVQPQQFFEYTVYFKPTEVRKYSDSIVFFSNAKEIDSITYITGEGIANPIIQAEDFNFGKIDIKDTTKIIQTIKITNTSSYSDLLINGFSNLKETAFQNELVWLDSMNYITVKPLEYIELPVSFKPNETRYYIDRIVVYSNASEKDSVIILEGEGIDDTTSVEDNNSFVNQIIISPNPASEYIEITVGANGSSPVLKEQIQIFNVYGNSIMKSFLTSPFGEGQGVRLDVSNFPDGIYFLRIGSEIQKFVVIK